VFDAVTEEEEIMIARQFKTECGDLESSLNELQFRNCLEIWSVPRKLIDFLFQAFDRYEPIANGG
jgi:hypothetical protein